MIVKCNLMGLQTQIVLYNTCQYNNLILMNYIALPSNFAVPDYRLLPNMQPAMGMYNQQFIRAISCALNSSIVAYQNSCNQSQTQHTGQYYKKDEKISIKISPVEIIEILSNEQQCVVNSINRKIEVRPLNEKKNISMSPIVEKQSPQLTQVMSAQEKSMDFAKMKVQNIEKNKKKVHRIQKKKAEGFQVVIPQIDQIETAYLPGQCFSADKMKLMRQQLLNRQVFQWSDKQKNKKDKRQIRNLGN